MIPNMDTSNVLTLDREKFREIVETTKSLLRLDNDEAKPLAGTDVTGRGTHQYVRLAIVSVKRGAPRAFMLFVESNFLFQNLHDAAGTPQWIREGFDDKWMYIQEILHRPGLGETLDKYSAPLSPKENHVWTAVFEFLTEQGIVEQSVRKYKAKTYGLPRDDSND